MKRWAGIVLSALASVISIVGAAAQQLGAPETTAYAPPQISDRDETPEARRARWELWRAANINIDSRISIFLHDTEAEIAAYRARPPIDRFAALRTGVTTARRQQALQLFGSAFGLWQSGDMAAAEIGFRRGLELDPTNGPGNYYMGDLMRRRGDNSGARDFYERSVAFGRGTPQALQAEAALVQLPVGPDQSINEPPVIWDVPSRPQLIWDCPDCPEMVVVPAGSFTMGPLPGDETAPIVDSIGGHPPRSNGSTELLADLAIRSVRHRVTIERPIAVGRFEVTNAQFRAFLALNATPNAAGCVSDNGHSGRWVVDNHVNWENAFTNSGDADPVVCVTYSTAVAYCNWLSQVTGKRYILLSDDVWEYAARAGTDTRFWTGGEIRSDQANFARVIGHPQPVGSYAPNHFGLYDMSGNVSEWVTHDCGPPQMYQCWRMNRGGSWADPIDRARSASFVLGGGGTTTGFRVARILN